MCRSCDAEKFGNEVQTVANLVARNANLAEMTSKVWSGRICVWRESGVRRYVLCWCVRQESDFICHEDVFTFNLVYKELL
jgi:hypothetical protein